MNVAFSRASVLFIHVIAIAFTRGQELAQLPDLIVTGKAENLLGEAASASQGHADAQELLASPYLRRSEILEIVPGLITTQHAGGGKATQYFLRGFNLDHGTDFAVGIDDMPVNMRTHAHGQGYADLNFLIPEFIDRLDYVKGPYTARNGDLSTAGSADFRLTNGLQHGFATFEIGEYNYYRMVAGQSVELGKGSLTMGGEISFYDGPWEQPEDFQRWNGLLRWFQGDEDNYSSVTFLSGATDWISSDQLAARGINSGLVNRFGTLDDTTGGDSQRHSLQFAWQQSDTDTVTRASAYAVYYDLDLFSNFTYFLDDPVNGDQFEQTESRWILGGEINRTWLDRNAFGKPADYTLGFQTRHDLIDDIGLHKTSDRKRLSTVRVDDVSESSAGLFANSTIRWSDWFRTEAGLRGDVFVFDVDSDLPANSGTEYDGIISPKVGAVFGPWADTELYLNFGMGFHSNDARGMNTTVDPSSGLAVNKVDPLVRTVGGEIGVRTQALDNLTSTLSLWWLDSDSELVYVGDAGTNEAGPASRRFGIEWANYWRPNDWFQLDGELAVTHARFRDSGSADHIPNSIPLMFSGGFQIGQEEGWFGGLRARVFDERPLEETGTIKGRSTFTLNGKIGYRRDDWQVTLECLNILDRSDNDIEYYYTSRLPGEPVGGVDGTHLHPAEPRMIRASLTYRF